MPKKIVLDPKLLTNKDKVLFKADKITKGELAEYYTRIAPIMLPYLAKRPISMQRFPEGIDHEGFYQKNVGSYFPDFVHTIDLSNSDGTHTKYAIVDNKETLIYLAYQAVITFHPWLSTIKKLDYPDRMIFDLDPGSKITFSMIKRYALALRDLLEIKGLKAFAMTTGSRGIHVTVPLAPKHNYDFVHEYARNIAYEFAALDSNFLTTEMSKKSRKGRLFIDYLRNSYGHTAVCPYSVRPLAGAPVATPVSWKEVSGKALQAQSYNIKNIFKRLHKVGDVWSEFANTKNKLH